MKKIIYLIPLTLLSCGLLQKNSQRLTTAQQKEEFELSHQSLHHVQKSELVLVDTSDSQFTLLLWPKGTFTFSMAEGFEGKAEKIIIKGKHSSQQSLKLNQLNSKDSVTVKAAYVKEKASLTSVKKAKTRLAFNWSWLLIPMIGYLGYWMYKRIR